MGLRVTVRRCLAFTIISLALTISVDSAASGSAPRTPTANQIKQCSTAALGHRNMTRSSMASCGHFPKLSQHCAKGPSVIVIKVGGKNIAIRLGAKPMRLGPHYTVIQLKATCGHTPTALVGTPSGPSPTTTTTSTASLDAAINALYYAETQAFQRGSAIGWQTVYSNDYPGAINQSQFQACLANTNDNDGYTDSAVPNLSTLMPAPTWTLAGPSSSTPYYIGQPAPPVGATYELQVTFDSTTGNMTELVHLTILNGKAYYYEGPSC